MCGSLSLSPALKENAVHTLKSCMYSKRAEHLQSDIYANYLDFVDVLMRIAYLESSNYSFLKEKFITQ